MTATALCPGMTGMQMAFVDDFELAVVERGQLGTQGCCRASRTHCCFSST